MSTRIDEPRMQARLQDWEDLLAHIVEPQAASVRNRERTERLLAALLQRAVIPEEQFWKLSAARRSRAFLSRFSRVSGGLAPLELSSFDLDRVAKERYRTEPLTIGAAWHHGYWRSYFSHAAITHPANDGLREEFSTAWDVLRRQAVLVHREPGGERWLDLPSVRFDLPILVGPLPDSDGITMERAYLEAIRRSDPGQDLRISTRVIVTSDTYRRQRDFYRGERERLLVRVGAAELLPALDGAPGGGWALAQELDGTSRILEIAVPPSMALAHLGEILERLHRKHPELLLSVYLRYGPEFWKQLVKAVRAAGVAMLHVYAGAEKSYRLIPAVDAALKRARLRSQVDLV